MEGLVVRNSGKEESVNGRQLPVCLRKVLVPTWGNGTTSSVCLKFEDVGITSERALEIRVLLVGRDLLKLG